MDVYASMILRKLCIIASEKEWENRFYTEEEIIDNLNSVVNFSKLDKVLMYKDDDRYVNILTYRKIVKNDLNCLKFLFHDEYKICCPKNLEKLWDTTLARFDNMSEDESSEISDYFDWSDDENSTCSEIQDYIISY
jgi:hypothetical protein